MELTRIWWGYNKHSIPKEEHPCVNEKVGWKHWNSTLLVCVTKMPFYFLVRRRKNKINMQNLKKTKVSFISIFSFHLLDNKDFRSLFARATEILRNQLWFFYPTGVPTNSERKDVNGVSISYVFNCLCLYPTSQRRFSFCDKPCSRCVSCPTNEIYMLLKRLT